MMNVPENVSKLYTLTSSLSHQLFQQIPTLNLFFLAIFPHAFDHFQNSSFLETQFNAFNLILVSKIELCKNWVVRMKSRLSTHVKQYS